MLLTFVYMLQMSLMYYMLLPYLLDGSINDVTRPNIYDQHFGLGLSDFSVPLRAGYMRPWRFLPVGESGLSHVINDKDSFKVNSSFILWLNSGKE